MKPKRARKGAKLMNAVLIGLTNKCVTFRMVNGDQITGFVRSVGTELVRLFVAGRTVYLVKRNIVSFRQATGFAC